MVKPVQSGNWMPGVCEADLRGTAPTVLGTHTSLLASSGLRSRSQAADGAALGRSESGVALDREQVKHLVGVVHDPLRLGEQATHFISCFISI